MRKLKALKIGFGLQVIYSMIRGDGEKEYLDLYFFDREPRILMRVSGEERIEQEFDEFVEKTGREITEFEANDSEYVLGSINLLYANVARYQPLQGGTLLPVPAKLANKKAVENVRNRYNECFKWALRKGRTMTK